MSAGRTIADAMRRQSARPDPEPIVDEFARGIAEALERRRVVKVPGLHSREDVAQAKHRTRVAEVVSALTPPATPATEAPTPTALPLNGAALLAHLVSNLGPGASSAHNGSSGV